MVSSHQEEMEMGSILTFDTKQVTLLAKKHLRAEFPVANTRTDFHARTDRRDGSDNFSAIVRGNAVATAQRRMTIARATISSLNSHKSSMLPPPRATTIRSRDCQLSFGVASSRIATAISRAAPVPWTRTGLIKISSHGALYAQEYQWDATFEALVAEIAARFLRRFDAQRERCWIAEYRGATNVTAEQPTPCAVYRARPSHRRPRSRRGEGSPLPAAHTDRESWHRRTKRNRRTPCPYTPCSSQRARPRTQQRCRGEWRRCRS